MKRVLVAVVALAGCDKLLGLTPLTGPGAAQRWQAVAVGGMHTCALQDDGSLWCWGDNSQGQIALGLPLELDEPTRIGTDSWAQVFAGEAHTCAARSDGALSCWGRNDEGETGTGAHGVQTTNVRLGLVQPTPSYETPGPTTVDGTWRTISAGNAFTCGLQLDGSLWCWGDDTLGQLADPALSVTRPSPRPVGPAGTRWTSVAAGAYHACAVEQDGSLWCWGYDGYGQIGPAGSPGTSSTELVQVPGSWSAVAAGGHSTCGVTDTLELLCWGAIAATSAPTPVIADGAVLGDVAEASVGGVIEAAGTTTTACARRGDGSVWCAGNSRRGQLGPSGGAVAGLEARAWPQGTWTQLVVGARHTCALGSDASLWCVGADSRGQLGDGGSGHHQPAPIAGAWQTVSTGLFATCAIDVSGGVACAGLGTRGALGNGDLLDRRLLSSISGTMGVTALALGNGYGCMVGPGTELACWGENVEGELGDNNASGLYATVPVHVNVQAVSVATSLHTCAIDPGKNLYCWGRGINGELTGGEDNSAAPILVTMVSAVDEVVDGATHTCSRSGGVVSCWGNNIDGESGNGTELMTTPNPTAIALPSRGPAIALTAGGFHTCALDADQLASCWGYNAVGQLGIDGLGNARVAVAIGPQKWSAISAGLLHTCGVQADGSLWCWGDNDFGQLGDGTLDSRGVPTRVADGGKTWTAVEAGGYHTCAIASDGSTWCWGNNDFGQLAGGDAWRDALVAVPTP